MESIQKILSKYRKAYQAANRRKFELLRKVKHSELPYNDPDLLQMKANYNWACNQSVILRDIIQDLEALEREYKQLIAV